MAITSDHTETTTGPVPGREDAGDRAAVAAALDRALGGRRLLDHPFYRRWEAGQLSREELAAYAAQYRHVEAALPELLGTIAGSLRAAGHADAAGWVERNLEDEQGDPVSHLALFDEFAQAVGAADASDVPCGPAASHLVDAQRSLAGASPLTGLAALAAYEVQASDVASSKAEGLRAHYGVDEAGTRFWDVHASMEGDHADWTMAALAEVAGGDIGHVEEAARRAADAWWGFLDEREACSAVPAI